MKRPAECAIASQRRKQENVRLEERDNSGLTWPKDVRVFAVRRFTFKNAMKIKNLKECPLCPTTIDRRHFVKTAALGSVALAAAPLGKAAKKKINSETLVAQLFGSLNESQKKGVAFPFEHPLREKGDNNWHITKKSIGEIFTGEQQALVQEIFLKLHSEQYAETVLGQVRHDSEEEGFESTSVALFGQPNTGKFEFVLTGRHCTRRCDGDSVEGEAFGGPIFYGHAARSFNETPDHPGNVYWYQAKQANKVFAMMDGKQRKIALLGKSREEQGTKTVALSGKKDGLPGIPMSELSSDQQGQVRKTMADLLAMFREKDAKEALKMVDLGGFDHLHLAFYENHDIGNDKVWDVWQIEGPNCLWFFRGDPHVHAWVNIKRPA